jgi:hypothetical protein
MEVLRVDGLGWVLPMLPESYEDTLAVGEKAHLRLDT